MSSRRWVLVLVGSAMAHVAVGGLALSAGRARPGPPVIVDLRADPGLEQPPRPRPAPVARRAPPVGPTPVARSVAAPSAAPRDMPRPLPEPPRAPPDPRAPSPPVPGPSADEVARPAVAVGPVPGPASPAPGSRGLPGEATPHVPAAGGADPGFRAGGGRSAGGAVADAPAAGEAASGSQAALAPSGDGGGTFPAEYGPYLARFRARVQEVLVYPLSARRRGLTGKVELELLIEPAGQVTSARVIVSSPYPVLDEAALDAVRSLPALPLPEHLPRRPLRVRLPLTFELR